MARSATPYTHPWQPKFKAIPTKRIYLPVLQTGYLGLRGLTPQNSVRDTIFLFSAEKKKVSSRAKKL